MAVAQQRTSANLFRALYNLSREHDTQKRQHLLNAGLVEMIKWFSLAARKILEGKMKLPKQTQKFMDRHKDDVEKLASAMVDPEIKRSIILKPGGGGYFGGTIIRSLIRWDGIKLMRKFGKKRSTKKSSQKTKKPSKKSKQVSKKSKKSKKTTNKSKKSKKTTKKTTQKRKTNERFITFRKRTPPRKQFTPPSTPSPLSSLPSPPSGTRSLVNSILQDMRKTPQKTSPPISRFSPLQPKSQAGKIGYQAAMRQLGYNQPFRVAGQPNLKFTTRKLHL